MWLLLTGRKEDSVTLTISCISIERLVVPWVIFPSEHLSASLSLLVRYPVFPWILANYKDLDFSKPSFRNLSQPMGAQDPIRLKNFQEKFEMMQEAMRDTSEKPYLWGQHYSSSAAVMHFMIRLYPFCDYHKKLQSGHFDTAGNLLSLVSYSATKTVYLLQWSILGNLPLFT